MSVSGVSQRRVGGFGGVKGKLSLVVCIVLSILSMVSAHPIHVREGYSVKEHSKERRLLDFTELEKAKVERVYDYCVIEVRNAEGKKHYLRQSKINTVEEFIFNFSTQHSDGNLYYHVDIPDLGDKIAADEVLGSGLSLRIFSTMEHRVHCRKALLDLRSIRNRARRERVRYLASFKHERDKYSQPKRHMIKV